MICWNDVWNFLQEVSAPISAIGTLLMTYYVYRLTSKSKKKESYFRHMAELYYRIEDDYNLLISLESNNSKDVTYLDQLYKRRIAVNSVLMSYYLSRIPGYYEERLNFIGILDLLSHNPEDRNNYARLSEKFKEFCWELRVTKKRRHRFSFHYDGKPIEK